MICGLRVIGNQRFGVEKRKDSVGRRKAVHALVKQLAEFPKRPEQLDAEHQDDQERFKLHRPRLDPVRTDYQQHRRTDRHARNRYAK